MAASRPQMKELKRDVSDWTWLGFALLGGALIGLFYFGGLWLTVRALPRAGNPGLLVMGSYVGRTAVSLLALYLLMDGRWERLLAGMAGFLVARYWMVRRYGN
jgi:F1F0 ATPase subunit 2